MHDSGVREWASGRVNTKRPPQLTPLRSAAVGLAPRRPRRPGRARLPAPHGRPQARPHGPAVPARSKSGRCDTWLQSECCHHRLTVSRQHRSVLRLSLLGRLRVALMASAITVVWLARIRSAKRCPLGQGEPDGSLNVSDSGASRAGSSARTPSPGHRPRLQRPSAARTAGCGKGIGWQRSGEGPARHAPNVVTAPSHRCDPVTSRPGREVGRGEPSKRQALRYDCQPDARHASHAGSG